MSSSLKIKKSVGKYSYISFQIMIKIIDKYFIMKFPKLSWSLEMGSKQWFFNFEDMKKGYLLGSIRTEIHF